MSYLQVALLFALVAAVHSQTAPPSSFFQFGRGGFQIQFNAPKANMAGICKQITLKYGKDRLSDAMGKAMSYMKFNNVFSAETKGSGSECLYNWAMTQSDPGNIYGDMYDTVIEPTQMNGFFWQDPCADPLFCECGMMLGKTPPQAMADMAMWQNNLVLPTGALGMCVKKQLCHKTPGDWRCSNTAQGSKMFAMMKRTFQRLGLLPMGMGMGMPTTPNMNMGMPNMNMPNFNMGMPNMNMGSGAAAGAFNMFNPAMQAAANAMKNFGNAMSKPMTPPAGNTMAAAMTPAANNYVNETTAQTHQTPAVQTQQTQAAPANNEVSQLMGEIKKNPLMAKFMNSPDFAQTLTTIVKDVLGGGHTQQVQQVVQQTQQTQQTAVQPPFSQFQPAATQQQNNWQQQQQNTWQQQQQQTYPQQRQQQPNFLQQFAQQFAQNQMSQMPQMFNPWSSFMG